MPFVSVALVTRDNETTPLYTNLDQHSGAHFKENLNFESTEHKGGRRKSSHCASFLYMCRNMSLFLRLEDRILKISKTSSDTISEEKEL